MVKSLAKNITCQQCPVKQQNSRGPVSADSVSAVSVIRGLLPPERKLENLRNKWFQSFKTRAKQERAITW
jgi:hypothetical protein